MKQDNTPWHTDESLQLPKSVYLLGSAPSALDGINLIPDDAFIIALNKAVLIKPECVSIWMCASLRYARQDEWWKEALAVKTMRLFGRGLSAQFGGADYRFNPDPKFTAPPRYQFIPGILRQATIAGCALQLCREKAVEEVIFCGIDMFSDTYFDGSKSHIATKAERRWVEADALDIMILMCKLEGIWLYSLTNTELDLKVKNERTWQTY